MRAGNSWVVKVPLDGDTVSVRVTRTLASAGYQVVPSFSLNADLSEPVKNPSSVAACACRLMMLLVYGEEGPPVTLQIASDPTPHTKVSLSGGLLPGWSEKLLPLLTEILLPERPKTSENDQAL